MEFIIRKPQQIDYDLKIIVIGKVKIGKSIFIKRISVDNNYKEFSKLNNSNYIPTIGVHFNVKFLKFNDKIFKLQIWDFSGDDRFENFVKDYYLNSNVILVFYNGFLQSFQKIKDIYNYQYNNNPNSIFALIRTKYELTIKSEDDEYVSDEEAMEYADKNNMLFAHISSFEKYDNGIEKLLNLILIEYLRKNNNYN